LKNNSLFRLFPVLLAVSFCIGCGTKLAGDDVAATVDGRKIYRADLEKYYQNQTAGSQQQPVGEQATSLRLSILRELVDNEILMRRAEKLGLLATDDEVERMLLIDALGDLIEAVVARTPRHQGKAAWTGGGVTNAA